MMWVLQRFRAHPWYAFGMFASLLVAGVCLILLGLLPT